MRVPGLVGDLGDRSPLIAVALEDPRRCLEQVCPRLGLRLGSGHPTPDHGNSDYRLIQISLSSSLSAMRLRTDLTHRHTVPAQPVADAFQTKAARLDGGPQRRGERLTRHRDSL